MPVADVLHTVAREAGITRLADLTGLDSPGFPVWQAVRPMSRALSVHQGKGMTVAVARRGAVMEAIESHHAEQWRAKSANPDVIVRARWADLDTAVRPESLADFEDGNVALAKAAPRDWIITEPLGESRAFAVPIAAVGLDCAAAVEPGLAVSSNGLAAHFEPEGATAAALLECVERDAVGAWQAAPAVVRSGTAIDPACIKCGDFGAIVRRCSVVGITLCLFAPAAPVPVIVAECLQAGADRAHHRRVWGSAAAFDWPTAARGAVLEALQTRCSQIAGARDTIPGLRGAGNDANGTTASGFDALAGTGWRGHAVPIGTNGAPHDVEGLLHALARRGFPDAGRIIVSPPGSAAVTVRVLVPGLGFGARARRR